MNDQRYQENCTKGLQNTGFFMEYPTFEEVMYFSRSLKFEERLSILSQGYHRGMAYVHCYSLDEFKWALGKREFDNPAGGVRDLNREEVVSWIRDVIGDEILAQKINMAFENSVSMAETTDRIRVLVYNRVSQYIELLEKNE